MYHFFKFCLLFIIINSYNCHCQVTLTPQIDSIKKNESPQKRISLFKSLLKKQDTTSSIEGLDLLYGELSSSYNKTKQYDSLIFYAKKAIEKGKQSSIKNKELLILNRFRLAHGYRNMNKQSERYQELLTIIKDEGKDLYTYLAYTHLSFIEINKGDIDKSIEYLNLALFNKGLSNILDNELNIRLLIIGSYAKKYESNFQLVKNNTVLEIVKMHYERIENQFQFSSINQSLLYNMYNNLAIIYDVYGDWNNALSLYTKARNLQLANGNIDSAHTALMHIGMIYSRQKKFNKASICYNTILKESNIPERKADVYDNMGYYLNTHNVEDKIPYFQKAINTSLNIPIVINDAFKLPSLKTIEDSGNIQDILIYLIDLAQHQVKAYKQNNNKLYLKKALQTLALVDKLVSLIRYETTSEQSKLFWIEKGVDSYMLAAEVSYLLNNVDKMFYFMEKNKALLLQEKINTLQTRLASNIPDTVLEREYNLHYKRLDAYKKYQDNINNTETQEDFVLQDKNYTVFMDSLKQYYPNYTKIKKQVDIINLKTITSNTNTCFVEYILSNTEGYGLFYCDNEVSMFRIEDVPKLQEQLIILKSYFTSPILNITEKQNLQHTGQKVFNTLFPFPDATSKLSGKHLTIIPDYTLETFPFEALTVSASIPLKESYFINNTEISYLQSFSAFKQIQQKENAPEEKLLAIAPHTFMDESLPELTGTKAIIDTLSNYTASTMLYETEATHANFLKYRNNYEIIHLSTHAGTNDSTQTPWIAFKDYNMSLNELYGLENQAELVVLDACETNTGELAIGEGTISLSRGFFFNGAQSVMASLWNVNEKAGNAVVNQFYRELQNGVTKSKALQESKIKYLQDHSYNEVLPYYWATFTLTGSTKTIVLSTKLNYALIATVVIISLLIITFLFWKRNKK